MRAWRHLLHRDLRFVVLTALTLVCLAGFLSAAIELGGTPGGWRRIDIQAVQARIRSGDLVPREAAWYHVRGAERAAGRRSDPGG